MAAGKRKRSSLRDSSSEEFNKHHEQHQQQSLEPESDFQSQSQSRKRRRGLSETKRWSRPKGYQRRRDGNQKQDEDGDQGQSEEEEEEDDDDDEGDIDTDEDEGIFRVEKILYERYTEDVGREFKIKWHGYNDLYNSWEPAIHLSPGVESLINEYRTRAASPSFDPRREWELEQARRGALELVERNMKRQKKSYVEKRKKEVKKEREKSGKKGSGSGNSRHQQNTSSSKRTVVNTPNYPSSLPTSTSTSISNSCPTPSSSRSRKRKLDDHSHFTSIPASSPLKFENQLGSIDAESSDVESSSSSSSSSNEEDGHVNPFLAGSSVFTTSSRGRGRGRGPGRPRSIRGKGGISRSGGLRRSVRQDRSGPTLVAVGSTTTDYHHPHSRRRFLDAQIEKREQEAKEKREKEERGRKAREERIRRREEELGDGWQDLPGLEEMNMGMEMEKEKDEGMEMDREMNERMEMKMGERSDQIDDDGARCDQCRERGYACVQYSSHSRGIRCRQCAGKKRSCTYRIDRLSHKDVGKDDGVEAIFSQGLGDEGTAGEQQLNLGERVKDVQVCENDDLGVRREKGKGKAVDLVGASDDGEVMGGNLGATDLVRDTDGEEELLQTQDDTNLSFVGLLDSQKINAIAKTGREDERISQGDARSVETNLPLPFPPTELTTQSQLHSLPPSPSQPEPEPQQDPRSSRFPSPPRFQTGLPQPSPQPQPQSIPSAPTANEVPSELGPPSCDPLNTLPHTTEPQLPSQQSSQSPDQKRKQLKITLRMPSKPPISPAESNVSIFHRESTGTPVSSSIQQPVALNNVSPHPNPSNNCGLTTGIGPITQAFLDGSIPSDDMPDIPTASPSQIIPRQSTPRSFISSPRLPPTFNSQLPPASLSENMPRVTLFSTSRKAVVDSQPASTSWDLRETALAPPVALGTPVSDSPAENEVALAATTGNFPATKTLQEAMLDLSKKSSSTGNSKSGELSAPTPPVALKSESPHEQSLSRDPIRPLVKTVPTAPKAKTNNPSLMKVKAENIDALAPPASDAVKSKIDLDPFGDCDQLVSSFADNFSTEICNQVVKAKLPTPSISDKDKLSETDQLRVVRAFYWIMSIYLDVPELPSKLDEWSDLAVFQKGTDTPTAKLAMKKTFLSMDDWLKNFSQAANDASRKAQQIILWRGWIASKAKTKKRELMNRLRWQKRAEKQKAEPVAQPPPPRSPTNLDSSETSHHGFPAPAPLPQSKPPGNLSLLQQLSASLSTETSGVSASPNVSQTIPSSSTSAPALPKEASSSNSAPEHPKGDSSTSKPGARLPLFMKRPQIDINPAMPSRAGCLLGTIKSLNQESSQSISNQHMPMPDSTVNVVAPGQTLGSSLGTRSHADEASTPSASTSSPIITHFRQFPIIPQSTIPQQNISKHDHTKPENTKSNNLLQNQQSRPTSSRSSSSGSSSPPTTKSVWPPASMAQPSAPSTSLAPPLPSVIPTTSVSPSALRTTPVQVEGNASFLGNNGTPKFLTREETLALRRASEASSSNSAQTSPTRPSLSPTSFYSTPLSTPRSSSITTLPSALKHPSDDRDGRRKASGNNNDPLITSTATSNGTAPTRLTHPLPSRPNFTFHEPRRHVRMTHVPDVSFPTTNTASSHSASSTPPLPPPPSIFSTPQSSHTTSSSSLELSTSSLSSSSLPREISASTNGGQEADSSELVTQAMNALQTAIQKEGVDTTLSRSLSLAFKAEVEIAADNFEDTNPPNNNTLVLSKSESREGASRSATSDNSVVMDLGECIRSSHPRAAAIRDILYSTLEEMNGGRDQNGNS